MKKFIIILTILFYTHVYGQDTLIKPFIKEWLGRPYRYGGESKKGIDCSALVQLFYKQIYNVLIPRTCEYILTFKDLKKINLSDLKIGDILIFKSKFSPSGLHAGIYIGNDEFLHAANFKEGVKISCLFSTPYMEKLIGIRRN